MREDMIYNPLYYQLRTSVIKRMLDIAQGNENSSPNGIVFYGDSLMERYPARKLLKTELPVYNCGISGYTSKELLLFVDEAVVKYQPSLVFLHAGTNDLGNTVMRSPREIAYWLVECAKLIQHNLVHAKVYIISPLPCIEVIQGYKVLHKGLRSNDTLRMIAEEVKQLCVDKQIEGLELYDAFLDREYMYEDGLHLNEEGYKLFSKLIEKELPL